MARIASTTSSGVPVDPSGGMTLDALMARAKEAAQRQGQIAAPRDMSSPDRKSTRLNSSHGYQSRMPSSA